MPGLGQVYNGQARKGAWLFLSVLVLILLTVPVVLHVPWAPWNVVVPVLVLAGTTLGIVAEAVMAAKRRTLAALEARSYDRWYVYLGFWIAYAVVVRPGVAGVLRARWIAAYRIRTAQMTPIVLPGDFVFVDRAAREPERGEVVLYRWTEVPGLEAIARVTGLPGDTVEVRNFRAYVNGRPWGGDEGTGSPKTAALDSLANAGPVRVPAGYAYVLCDHRTESFDSRVLGPIPFPAIVGRVARVYWSWDEEAARTRWGRIGVGVR
jgi:signal peptidase I